MQRYSRRKVAGGIAGLLVGLAGCSTTEDTPPSATSSDGHRLPNSSRSPSRRSLRNSTGDAAVRTAATPELAAEDWTPSHWLVTSSKERQLLDFNSDSTGIQTVKSFLNATDFVSAAVLVFQRSVPACLKRVIKEIRWDTDKLALQWTTTRRDGECNTDASNDTEALFVRIPSPMTELSYFGSSSGE